MPDHPRINTSRGDRVVIAYAEPNRHCMIVMSDEDGRLQHILQDMTEDDLAALEAGVAAVRARIADAKVRWPDEKPRRPIPHEERMALEARFDGPIPQKYLYQEA